MTPEDANENPLIQGVRITSAQGAVETESQEHTAIPASSNDSPDQMLIQARRLLTEVPLIGILLRPARNPHPKELPSLTPARDGHNDFPYIIRGWFANKINSPTFSINTLAIGQTDLSRLSLGHVGAQFWSAFVPWYNASLLT